MTTARELIAKKNPAVEDVIQVFRVLTFSTATSASNGGFISIMLKDWSERPPLDEVDGHFAAPASGPAGSNHHDLRAADAAGVG
ncbi:hydrophobe/amphiphile efflux-1 (HAE1) family protein [Enterobacter cancerogenus]|uniref:Hydrophobe/amphiphile efflux-1 (HAE1) family protein n=1 Tax=Enterobacter cancerogenus TaxID=69218 RepID=A0A484YNK0_9ENTR|nr:hydrophobe/amphiphile efflux-1 (HAE1) family protein [Enterobacter cancerogenus]